MLPDDSTKLRLARQNFDIRKTSQEQKNSSSSATKSPVAEQAAHICYEPQPHPLRERAQTWSWWSPLPSRRDHPHQSAASNQLKGCG